MIKRILSLTLLVVASTAPGRPLVAATAFDFEDTAPGFYNPSLSVTEDGLTLTITTEGFPGGFVAVDNQFVPPELGLVSVIGTQQAELSSGSFAPLRFSFSELVGDITFLVGDGGGDNDAPAFIRGYDDSDNLLGTLTIDSPWDGTPMSLAGSFAGARYFLLESFGNQSNDHSIFWEISSVERFNGAIPEPSSLALAASGLLAGLASIAIRRRRSA